MHRAFLLVLALLVPAVAGADERIFIPDQPFDMQHIRLDLDIDLPAERLDATADLSMRVLAPAALVELDAVDFQVRSVEGRVAGGDWAAWPHRYDGRKLGVHLPAEQARGTDLDLRIRYVVQEPASGLSFFSPEKNGAAAPLQVWSQGESIENRYWVPCFDHPNEMQTTEIIATVDRGFEVLSNGALRSRRETDDGRVTFHWKMSRPHVVYLMTLVVGEFHVAEETWRGIPVTYYVPPDRADQVEPTFRHTTAMLDLFTDKLGVRYPWEKYAQVCCHNFGGGMENTSATTLGEASLLDAHTRLDRDADGLIAHELAHQWFGDLVTCRDWAHLWLNEGFASYFEVLWDEHVGGPQALAYNLMGKARSAIRGGKDLPIVHQHYDHPDSQFDARAYPKGAWVVHMLRRELGDDLFWAGLQAYLREFAHQPVETADLRRTLERVSGRSLERFFHDWTERPGHPVVEIDYRWLADDKLAEVSVTQTQDDEAFHFPLVIEFVGQDQTVRLRRDLTSKQERYLVPLGFRPDRISIDPDMRVLMDLTATMPRRLWEGQLRDDPNPVNRIAAVKHLGRSLDDHVESLMHARLAEEPFWAVRRELLNALAESESDATRAALLATLSDPDARVRRTAVDRLADFDEPEVRRRVTALLDDADQSYAVRAAAISALADWAPNDLLDRVRPLLAIDDPRGMVRQAVLGALGATADPAAVEPVLAHLGDQHGTRTRRSAITAIRQLSDDVEMPDDQREEVVTALAACVEGGDGWLQLPAARALGALGPDAAAALPALRAALDDDPRERTREALENAVAKIDRAAEAAPAVAQAAAESDLAEENSRLRAQLDALRGEHDALATRVASLEALVNGYQAVLDQMAGQHAGPTGSASTAGE